MRLSQVNIRRTDNNTDVQIHLRHDRLEAFCSIIPPERLPSTDRMPGFSGMAGLGLSTIFADIPCKFPIIDLARFLASQAETESIAEVEARLEAMGRTVPAIDCEGNDIL
jgi:hypothetical protein